MNKNEKRLNMTQEDVSKILDYDPNTGVIRWRVDRTCGANKRVQCRAGTIAGHKTDSGYVLITLNYCRLYAHRIAWFLTHGRWPTDKLDHINLNRSDNRIENLREATDIQNRSNTKVRSKTGFKGVTKPKHANTFVAQISVNGKTHYLGAFKTPEEAHEVYAKAAWQHFGEFARMK